VIQREDLAQTIRNRYGARAAAVLHGGAASCCGDSSCCGDAPTGANVFSEGLYLVDELDGLSLRSALSTLGCGNPAALSDLRPGEIVLDLGSGGGLDVILGGRRVGASGHVYGLDATDEMLELAWRNAADAGIGNVSFIKGDMQDIPIPDGCLDVVMSNCVINLAADKRRVFREMRRVLRPTGRVAIADIVIRGGLPPVSPVSDALRSDPAAWGSCLGGAMSDAEYPQRLREAGFRDITVEIVREHTPEELLGRELPAWARACDPGELRLVMSRFASALIGARLTIIPDAEETWSASSH
jgi:arsenite methyltransferase